VCLPGPQSPTARRSVRTGTRRATIGRVTEPAGGQGATAEPPQVGLDGGTVTLVEGSSFCVCRNDGDIDPGPPHGVFFRDTRIVSVWRLRVDGDAVEPLVVLPGDPYRARFVARARPRPGHTEPTLLVERDRFVGVGMREDLVLRNVGTEPAGVALTLSFDADFADVFEVKEGRVRSRYYVAAHSTPDGSRLTLRLPDRERSVLVAAHGATTSERQLSWRLVVPPHGEWRTTVQVQASEGGVDLPVRFPSDVPLEHAVPVQRLRDWRHSAPQVVTADPGLARALQRSLDDLATLRIHDPEHPEIDVVAAGAPWFMTLFGRDSILASYMALPLDQSLAVGTLQTLARYQGTRSDPLTEEQPGRILHEMRFGVDASLALGGGSIYYGTIDATPLFVMLLGELRRWGIARKVVDELLPHADAALEWMLQYGDRDGDGFVEYERSSDRGLAHQGWKDSWDAVTHADGHPAAPPIALCEVQGYVYAAYIARSHFAREVGDDALADEWSERAKTLKERFNQAFWLADRGYFAVALDGAKRPVDALASNMGHCLWTGIVDEDKAQSVAEHLVSPEMFSGWGVRTLATSMAAYNPLSYHNGSVWPHDNALIVAGLIRYGCNEAAQRITGAVLDAADAFGGRLPELMCGFDRAQYSRPVPYPTSCSPQAWASASPVQLLRSLLRFDPWVPQGKLWIDPVLPPELAGLEVRGVRLAGQRFSVAARQEGLELIEVPEGLEVITEPRHPLSSAV
jgi:glycogen debranching enzyme